MTEKVTITNSINQIERWFDIINDQFYGNELEKPVITIMPDHKKKALGWFTTWKAWERGEKKYHEINITADFTDRKPLEIMETLMHECVHLYNSMKGIQDCSRGGTYHNKKFKDCAETHGLSCQNDKKYGWTLTSLTEQAKNKLEVATYNEIKYEIMHREQPTANQKKKAKSYRHVCQNCGLIARTTKPLMLICAQCLLDWKEGDSPVVMEITEV